MVFIYLHGTCMSILLLIYGLNKSIAGIFHLAMHFALMCIILVYNVCYDTYKASELPLLFIS